MQNLIQYIRKNAVFLALLLVLLICCVFFGGYIWTQRSVQDPSHQNVPPVKEESQPSISSFEGTYGHDAAVHLNWTIDRADKQLLSLKLYYGDSEVGGEMKDLSSFSMAQSVYQFPTGNCQFTLKALFSDDVEVSKEVSVFISYVQKINMQKEESETGVLLKLSYTYDKNNPVSVPSIKLLNTGNHPFAVAYQDTKREQNGNLERAETTYVVDTSKLEPGDYHFTIRWIFNGLNISKDYNVDITKTG